ncbi:MAG: HAD family phosphatase [Patescibacteria group bacterium]
MSLLKAIIFDMDGVITDSEPLHQESELLTLKKYNIKVPLSEWKNFKGRTSLSIFAYIVKKFAKHPLVPEELVSYTRVVYHKIATGKIKIFPGVKLFIKWSRKAFNKVALTTSSHKETQQLVFDKFALSSFFDLVITAEDIVNGKPNPEPYLKTIKRLKLPAEQCLVIEDSVNGVISAKKAGCMVIGITNTFSANKLKKAGADYVVKNFKEISQLVKNLLK